MTLRTLLLRNVLYHWRGNLAVLLGVMIGSAVLTGALLVGDSLGESLRSRALVQLGWVDHLVMGQHLVHEGLAAELGADHACPVLLMQGTAENSVHDDLRAGNVTVLGVDQDFWYRSSVPVNDAFWKSATAPPDQVVLSKELAELLHVSKGDKVDLQLPKFSPIPRESALGQPTADRARTTLTLSVAAVLDADHLGSQFSLVPSSGRPRNAFLPLAALQQALQEAAAEDSTHVRITGRVNAILAAGDGKKLKAALHERLTLEDWGLVLRDPESRTAALFERLSKKDRPRVLQRQDYAGRIGTDMVEKADTNHDGQLTYEEVLNFYRKFRNYLSLESERLLLEPFVVDAARRAADDMHLKTAPAYVYLADRIASDGQGRSYVLVAAVDPALAPPFEPLIPGGAAGLKDSEILFAQWGEPLLKGIGPGAKIRMAYYDPETEDRLHDDALFTLKGFVPVEGAAADPDMTPEIPGVTDRQGLDWDLPPQLHYQKSRLQEPDDTDFWDRFRTTPRAYITLARGQELWKNRFGNATSVRMEAPDNRTADLPSAEYRARLLDHLDPDGGGLGFEPIRSQRLHGAAQSNDFSVLFLGFSCFIIVAALLLVGLLFRLNLDRRAAESGLLLALGYRGSTLRNLLLAEGCVLSAVGAALGLLLTFPYARFLLLLLRWWWPGHLDRSFLQLHATPTSMLIGFLATIAVAMLTIFWVSRSLIRVSVRVLLSNSTTEETKAAPGANVSRWKKLADVRVIGGTSLVIAIAALAAGFVVQEHEAQAGAFFTAGLFFLIALLSVLWAWMRRTRRGLIHGRGMVALGRLAVRNAARHPVRSLLTSGLLAAAAFIVVAVQSFRKEPGSDLADKRSGSGGLTTLAETDLPLYHPLQEKSGTRDIVDNLRRRLQDRKEDAPTIRRKDEEARQALAQSTIFSCRLKPGDDASCLNLSQPGRPRILGLPDSFLAESRFRFAQSEAGSSQERDNPWLLLDRELPDGVIPVIADATTAEWTLHTKLGGTLLVPGPGDTQLSLRIVGLLQDSIFQSELLMSAANFEKHFPEQGGFRFFLIDAPPEQIDHVESLLSQSGFEVTPARERLRAYFEVENTYLATFQALGALGLVLGTLGLGIVLVRSVWERRGELALLRALGYGQSQLGWLVLAENGFLLIVGLGMGTLAALLAISPQLLTGMGAVPWLRLAAMLLVVVLAGMAAGAVAVISSLRADLIPALRRE
jgi:ABC-type lipoprotein release transport system permease subunit